MKVSQAQLRRDEAAILAVLAQHTEPVSFDQISLQAGEALWPAMLSLWGKGEIERREIIIDDDSFRVAWVRPVCKDIANKR